MSGDPVIIVYTIYAHKPYNINYLIWYNYILNIRPLFSSLRREVGVENADAVISTQKPNIRTRIVDGQ